MYINNKQLYLKKNLNKTNIKNFENNLNYIIQNFKISFKQKYDYYMIHNRNNDDSDNDSDDDINHNNNKNDNKNNSTSTKKKQDEVYYMDKKSKTMLYKNISVKFVIKNNNNNYNIEINRNYYHKDNNFYTINIEKITKQYASSDIVICDKMVKVNIKCAKYNNNNNNDNNDNNNDNNDNTIISHENTYVIILKFIIELLENMGIKMIKLNNNMIYYLLLLKDKDDVDKIINLNFDINIVKNSDNIININAITKNIINEFRNIKIKDMLDKLDKSKKILRKFIKTEDMLIYINDKKYINNSKNIDVNINVITYYNNLNNIEKFISYHNRNINGIYIYEILLDNTTCYMGNNMLNLMWMIYDMMILLKSEEIMIDFTNIKLVVLKIRQLIEYMKITKRLN